MRKLCIALASAAALLVGVAPAAAWDKCHPALSAKGKKAHSMREAMSKAKYAWHEAAEKKYEDDYANWYYSGDRAISCSWDKPGTHFTCSATARPCARDD